jgi:predicted aminopeptidase
MSFYRLVLILMIATAVALATACSSLGYYSQAIGGQLKLLHQRQSIEDLLQANDTDPRLKDQLQQVQQMRKFAFESLHLPENDSYSSYAETGREAVVWNVVAAPRYSIEPVTWCYPIAGCVPYRGYFELEKAEQFAAGLADDGMDVAITPATAYSTLGWFDDPLLDTMLRYPDYRLAGLIFHELAHQQLYIKGDATFNESFASVVERAGIAAWIGENGDEELRARWVTARNRQSEFRALLSTTRQKLHALYQTGAAKADLSILKAAIFAELRRDYTGLKTTWNDYAGYDYWFDKDLNNAHFALHATYEQGTAAFTCLLGKSGGDFTDFYRAAAEIGGRAPAQRKQCLSGGLPDDTDCTAPESVPD